MSEDKIRRYGGDIKKTLLVDGEPLEGAAREPDDALELPLPESPSVFCVGSILPMHVQDEYGALAQSTVCDSISGDDEIEGMPKSLTLVRIEHKHGAIIHARYVFDGIIGTVKVEGDGDAADDGG